MNSVPLTQTRPARLGPTPFPTDKAQASDDEVFIVDGYWKSWKGSPWAGTTPRNWSLALAIETLRQLKNRGAQFMVLESPEYDTLVGFICFEISPRGREVLHYVYVKDLLRQKGFGQQLLDSAELERGVTYTHRTRFSRYLRDLGRHRPELARQKTLK